LYIPLFDRILIKQIEDDAATSSGLLIPDIARNTSIWGYGEVVGIGPGRHDHQGNLVKVKLKVWRYCNVSTQDSSQVPIPTGDGEIVFFAIPRARYSRSSLTDLPKKSILLDSEGKRLLSMNPASRGRPDIVYENTEKTEIARREGWLDINQDGTDDHIDEDTHLMITYVQFNAGGRVSGWS